MSMLVNLLTQIQMSVPVRQFQASSGVPIFYPINTPGDIGPRGPATPGPTGPRGIPASESGGTGPTGPQGPQGFPGPTGTQGAPSRTGATGPTGSSAFVGPAGVGTGATGPRGATGPAGNTVDGTRVNQLGPLNLLTGNQPSLYQVLNANGSYQVGYLVARCITTPSKSVAMKLYGQNQNVFPPGANTDLISVVGNNINTDDVQQTTQNTIASGNYASLELVNSQQGGPGPYSGVQLKSFFPGGGTESWIISVAPNMVSATPF